jgi:hypothetical protein
VDFLQITLDNHFKGRPKAAINCVSSRDIEICAVLQPKEGEEMGMETLEGCSYCDENGHCHFPGRKNTGKGVIN